MGNISFDTNNGRLLVIKQEEHDGKVTVEHLEKHYGKESYTISNGDFVMLINLYRYIKDNDIQNDFINPNGKNKEEGV